MSDTSPTSAKPIKGILKHQTGGAGSESHLKWDEENLKLTEDQKDSTMKVDEPKTPFIHYDPETDTVHNRPADVGYGAAHEEPEEFTLDAGHESDRSSASSRKERKVSMSDDGWDSPDENLSNEEKQKQHEEFEKKRAEHYNMGNVLRHNVDDEVDDDDERMSKSLPPMPGNSQKSHKQ